MDDETTGDGILKPDDSRIVRATDEPTITIEIKRIMDMPGCHEDTKWLLLKAIEIEMGRLEPQNTEP